MPEHYRRSEIAFRNPVRLRGSQKPDPCPGNRQTAVRFAHIEQDAVFSWNAVKPAGKVSSRASRRSVCICGGQCSGYTGGSNGGKGKEFTTIAWEFSVFHLSLLKKVSQVKKRDQ